MEQNYIELNGDCNYEQLQVVINNKQWEEAEETYLLGSTFQNFGNGRVLNSQVQVMEGQAHCQS